MARRMEPKDADELALDDKLDIARSIIGLRKRIEKRHELNEIEAEIKQRHRQEIEDGRVTRPVLPSADDLRGLYGFGTQAIEKGSPEAGSARSRD